MAAEDTLNDANVAEDAKVISFNVKLPSFIAAEEALKVQSFPTDTLSDLTSAMQSLPITQNLTNFAIYCGSVNLGELFNELDTLEEIFAALGVQTDEILLELKERLYNLNDVFLHLSRFRESVGLHFIDRNIIDFGVMSGSGKFHNLKLEEEIPGTDKTDEKPASINNDQKDDENNKEKKEPVVLSDENKTKIDETVNDLVNNLPKDLESHGELENILSHLKLPLKSLSLSQWNPVSASRKVKGDLLYITLQTLENETYHITCHSTGFFVNRSSTSKFNPEIKHLDNNSNVSKDYLLINLVDRLSPSFSKVIKENEVALATIARYPESYLLPTNCTPASPWIVKSSNAVNIPDFSRGQFPLINNGVDGAEFVKEWNEDFQAIKELPNETVNERILRDKFLMKLLHDFNKAASNTAISIVNGEIPPLNPNEPTRNHIYLRNGIFYSFGVDANETFALSGGDEASRYTSVKDLNSIKLLNRYDAKGIYNLVSCVVDYMGKRVLCQAPVPGIFQDSQDTDSGEIPDKVQYGLSTDGSVIYSSPKFEEALKPIAEAFHLKSHNVDELSENQFQTKLITSKDMKGVQGTDNRKYIIDLYRATPLDIEFIEKNWTQDESSYPHREVVLRHEAVEEWWKRKVSSTLKDKADVLDSENKEKDSESAKPQIVLAADQVVFNPDAFTSTNCVKEDEDQVRDISSFVKQSLIEEFLDDISRQMAPFDGVHLSYILHRKGINLRYLGYIASQAESRKQASLETSKENMVNAAENTDAKKSDIEKSDASKETKADQNDKDNDESSNKKTEGEDTPQETSKGDFDPVASTLSALYKVCIQEMVARSSKHILRNLLSQVSNCLAPNVVAHYHNCLFGANINGKPKFIVDEGFVPFLSKDDLKVKDLDSEAVLALIRKEVYNRFRFELPSNWLLDIVNPLLLFREIALKAGIQWKSQNYGFTKETFEEFIKSLEATTSSKNSKQKKNKKGHVQNTETHVNSRETVFIPDDIESFVPIVKDASYRPRVIDEVFETARYHINKGEKEIGVSLLDNLAAIYVQVYGRVHPETAKFYSLLAQYYAELEMSSEACLYSHKACILMERTIGFDSHETITTYINSAFFESSVNNYTNSLKLYHKALSDWVMIFGKDHPAIVNTFANLAELLVELSLKSLSKKAFEKSISVSAEINGEESPITGMLRYRYGGALVAANEFKAALDQFKITSEIFAKNIGPDDVLTKKASNFVKNITTYLTYTEKQKAESKKQMMSDVKSTKGNAKSKTNVFNKGLKKGRKNKSPLPNPEIALQSVDEIMQFIEGKSKRK